MSGEEFEWVPLMDAATMWPGALWWDGREPYAAWDAEERKERVGDDRG